MKKRATIKIFGGLGNQLFQYFFSKYLKNKYQFDIDYDFKWFLRKEFGNIKQNLLLKKLVNENFEDTQIYPLFNLRYLNRMSYPIKKFFNFFDFNYKYIFENDFEIKNIKSININKKVYFYGYWQKKEYVDSQKNIIKEIGKNLLRYAYNKNIYEEIIESNSIFIHIRRGDYLNKKNYRRFGNICTEDYYLQAIKFFLKNYYFSNLQFFIFSNDKEWSKNFIMQNFSKVQGKFKIIYGKDPLEDLALMSICKNSIIANSSFSWWGVKLNEKKEIVISPSKWINKNIKNIDLIYDSWLKINNKGEII
ncbi:Glycosyl transferase family 11 [Marinitoga piezophila KA3]|uniref:Glycosyl transferase family 11 n=1 Tax=Marinitoga piezophila (strain DSM 14283 / JCM 11233 / KA3) TaxID=443254 RepID=H2J8E6_MARPK|nr:alpha-1,2-fucosyltransferase [Marinitoga piezophila]AEX85630.1 Glycosyl transferase family 11 [Marinitoga piezophila KA3]